ncbi:MAG: hypothetical protein FJ399_10670 [Verrucomicrobia bacterium]|nr:hypothetical protein [Verrucomicrobiota bacterium]
MAKGSTAILVEDDTSGVATALREQVHAAFTSAERHGIPAIAFMAMVNADARPMIEDGAIREGYATAEEGLALLLNAEGGCVDLVTAGKLFKRPGGVTRQTLWEKIKHGELIAYQTAAGRWMLPKWQFRPQGGLLRGLPDVLVKIRETLPEAGELFPFTFFLQPNPATGDKTPLEALRSGAIALVLTAVEGEVVA